MTDEQLVRAAADGDPDAFAAIAAPRLDRLFATASLILRDRGDPYGDVESPTARCGVISRDETAAIVEALTELGVSEANSVGMDRATVASLDWADGNGTVDPSLLPRMPGEYPGCDRRH